MTAITNAENLQYDKRKFSLIVQKILTFALNTDSVGKLRIYLQTTCTMMFYVKDNCHSDRQIQFIVKL